MSIPKMDKSGIRRILIAAVTVVCVSTIGAVGYHNGKKVEEAIEAPESPSESIILEEVVPPTFEEKVLQEGLEAAIEAVSNDTPVIVEETEKKKGFFAKLFGRDKVEVVDEEGTGVQVYPDTFLSAKAIEALSSEGAVKVCSATNNGTLAITTCGEVENAGVGKE